MTDQPHSTNIRWHTGHVAREDRERRHGHKAAVLWFTGLSGSGKSTLASAVEKALFDTGCTTYILDGDNVRHGLNRNLTFAPEDRVENIRRIAEVSRLFVDAGAIVLTAFISPYRADRDAARALVGDAFCEIHVQADLATCESRDVKGLYKKARAGQIPDFTGISAPYEEPLNPELVVDTAKDTLESCTTQVLTMLRTRGIIR